MTDEDDDGDGSRSLAVLLVAGLGLLVVGTVVVVVLVVILSAVVGTFVLGIGESTQPAPRAAFSFEHDPAAGTVAITHAGGDEMAASSVRVTVDGRTRGTWAELGEPGTVGAGDRIRVDDVERGDVIRLVWESPDGGTVSSLDSYRVGRRLEPVLVGTASGAD